MNRWGRALLLGSVLLLPHLAGASQITVMWEAPAPQAGITITGYMIQACTVPTGGVTCVPSDLPNGTVGASIRTFVDTSVIPGRRYCYAGVTLGTGGEAPRSVPTTPPVCAVAPSDLVLPDTPQNFRAVVP